MPTGRTYTPPRNEARRFESNLDAGPQFMTVFGHGLAMLDTRTMFFWIDTHAGLLYIVEDDIQMSVSI